MVAGTVAGVSTESSAKANDRYYNGKEAQDVVGWYDFGARMYNPEIGRWMNVDPSHEDGGQESFTPYGYVFDNPIKLTDPDGRQPCCGGNPAAALLTQAKSQWEGIKSASSNFLNRAESFASQALTYTDVNDATVLVTTVTRGGNGINIDGSKATGGDIAMAALGAVIPVASGSGIKKGAEAVADKVSDVISNVSPNVQKVLNTIADFKKEGGKVIPAKKLEKGQELNVTFENTDGSKLDLRVETHTLSKSVGGSGDGKPQRHLNAEVTNSGGNKVKMKHINGGHKILE